jgi:glycosyltransferase involved in cell wall biosynthesis
MGNWYLREPMLRYLALCVRELDDTRVLIVTRDDHGALRRDAAAAGLPPDRLVLRSAPFDEMPRYVRLMDAGVFFISPAPSKRGSAATKLAEFLGCGVPVIVNDGVGDSGTIVRTDRVGVVLPDVAPAAQLASLDEVRAMLADPGIAARCRAAALARFDVAAGAERYASLYRRLIAGSS